jgi:glycosyltransferase involved in cell wall biosynthesis
VKKSLVDLGAKEEKMRVIPAYITPVVRGEDIDEIPGHVWDYINSHSPVISVSVSRLSLYNNQDLYGIDMCIELYVNLKDRYPDMGFIICLSGIEDYEYYHTMRRAIADKGIENNFLFQAKPCQMYPIIMKSDIFVRPTNTDSYGSSISEAIDFNVPAVASNVCLRPKGTVLFENRNIEDFTSKVKDVLDNLDQHKERIVNIESENSIDDIIEVYRGILMRAGQ